jgi:purine-binding chemotaxis protein CheW
LAVVRGTAIPVIDAHRLLVGSEAPAPPSRFVTLKLGVRRASLAVGDIVGVREIDPSVWQSLPPLLRDASSELVKAIGRLESELLLLLDSARVVPESMWSSLDAGQVTT